MPPLPRRRPSPTTDPPPTNPSPSPPPAGAGSTDSSRGSATAPSGFVSDPGDFDPGRAAERGDALDAEPKPEGFGEVDGFGPLVDDPLWDEAGVRNWLVAQGALVHSFAGVTDDDWHYTEAELTAIAGPVSRILNRYDATRALAGVSDEGAAAMGFGAYAGRNWNLRRQVIAARRAAAAEQPASGVAAEPGTGPPPASVNGDQVAVDLDVDPASIEWNR